MNKVIRTGLVLLASVASLGVVYTMTATSPPSQANQNAANKTEVSKTSRASSEKSLSPNLSKVDPYIFLDLVPAGKQAPDFSVKDAAGKSVNLSDYRDRKNVALIFYQGSFCSVCAAQLSNIQQHLSQFRQKDTEIIAISADDAVHAQKSIGENGLSFPVIPDSKSALIQSYGVSNISKKGIAWPSVYIIDKKGKVAFSFADPSGRRLHSDDLLKNIPH